MQKLKAKFTKNEHTGKICQNRKENHFFYSYSVLVPYKAARLPKEYMREGETMARVIDARIYFTPSRMYGNTAYACIWVNDRKREGRREAINTSGGGKAGGYGYHKASAALQSAIDNAGIKLNQSIGGVGESAMREALCAMARALGYRNFHILEAHG